MNTNKLWRSYKTYKFFYFCYDYDLSTNLQKQRRIKKEECKVKSRKKNLFDKKFTWNGDLELFHQIFKYKEWLVPIIHGYVGDFEITGLESMKLRYALVSRRSRFAAGARYLKRGLNKEGHWANEVESEHILCTVNNESEPNTAIKISSFIQIRASIPLFWCNTMIKSIKPKFKYLKDKNINYTSSFKHFTELRNRYGDGNICILNLIRQKQGETNESCIGNEFRNFWGNAMESKLQVVYEEKVQNENEFEIVTVDESPVIEETKEASDESKSSESESDEEVPEAPDVSEEDKDESPTFTKKLSRRATMAVEEFEMIEREDMDSDLLKSVISIDK